MGQAAEQIEAVAGRTDDPSNVYARLPRAVVRLSPNTFLIAMAVWVVLATIPLWPGLDVEDMLFIFGATAVMIGVMLGVFLYFFATRQSHLTHNRGESLSPVEMAIAEQDGETPLFGGTIRQLWSWDDLTNRFQVHNAALPRTIVDRGLRKRLEAIERASHLLEPEPILPSTYGNGLGIFFLVFYLLFAVLQLVAGYWFFAGFMVLLGALVCAISPALRDRLRIFHVSEGKITAGQGWIKDRQDRAWTTADSMMIITLTSGWLPMSVIFTGPAGVVAITFANERDPDFVKLWQRWNHPDPRPELAAHDH